MYKVLEFELVNAEGKTHVTYRKVLVNGLLYLTNI